MHITLKGLEAEFEMTYAEEAELVAQLTDREHEVFIAMGKGGRNRQIAVELNISPKTLDIHRTAIYRKLAIETANSLAKRYWFLRMCEEYAGGVRPEKKKAVRV